MPTDSDALAFELCPQTLHRSLQLRQASLGLRLPLLDWGGWGWSAQAPRGRWGPSMTYKGLLPSVISQDAAVEAFQQAVHASARPRKGTRHDPEISYPPNLPRACACRSSQPSHVCLSRSRPRAAALLGEARVAEAVRPGGLGAPSPQVRGLHSSRSTPPPTCGR
jgi:hypothetical protein